MPLSQPSQTKTGTGKDLYVPYTSGGSGGAAYNVDWTWSSGNAPTYAPLQMTATAAPSPAFNFLQARWTRNDPGPYKTQTFYTGFDHTGALTMSYIWDGYLVLPWTLNGRPITIIGDNTSVLTLVNEQGGSGNFQVDASNNLYWNGTKLN